MSNTPPKDFNDSQLQGLVLQELYDQRREGKWIDPVRYLRDWDPMEVYRLCDLLDENCLIDWKPIRQQGYTVTGRGHINARGIDVIERDKAEEEFNIQLPVTQNHITINQSSGFQIGDHNTMQIVASIKTLVEEIEASDGTPEEKQEAKSKLRAFIEHPLVNTALGAAASTLLGLLGG
jgi:hypothetical protein